MIAARIGRNTIAFVSFNIFKIEEYNKAVQVLNRAGIKIGSSTSADVQLIEIEIVDPYGKCFNVSQLEKYIADYSAK